MNVFLHIAKTAGSTVQGVIEQNYPARAIFSCANPVERSLARFLALSGDTRRKIKVLKGHFRFGAIPPLDVEVRYFTFVRAPVFRYLSAHLHKERSDASSGKGHDKSFSTAIEDSEIVTNKQVRLLAGVDDGKSVDRGDLMLALENVDRWFDFVGLSERVDESLLFLSQLYSWRSPLYYSRNIAPRHQTRRKVDPHVLDMIADRNSLDLELYETVKSRFEKQIGSLGRNFPQKLEEYRRERLQHARLIRCKMAIRYCCYRLQWKLYGWR